MVIDIFIRDWTEKLSTFIEQRISYRHEIFLYNCYTEAIQNGQFLLFQKPTRWVSMLLLFTEKPGEDMVFNSMCMVTYEVVEWDIRVYSDVSQFPIVCSLKLHYVGIEYEWHFFIKNFTPILGCFWLRSPIGEEVDKMAITFHPKFGMIRPGEKIKVIMRAVPKETGIIEKIFVPCFISKSSPPIMIRILAAIDDVNVYFYIPSQAEGYDKILWPPKLLNEVDFQELVCIYR